MKKVQKAALIILDGWGHGENPNADAIKQAETPFVDSLYKDYPNTELITFGQEVGLPEGQMGNSEVGHLNIGAGRVVYQELARINKAIEDKTLHQNPVIGEALAYARSNGKKVHLLGLVSDGGVHSHINHLKALCDICEEQGQKEVFIHAFMDGRDTDPKGGASYLASVLEHIEGTRVELASVIGRYYAMDRDKRWERVKLAYDLLVKGTGEKSTDILATLEKSYEEEITDEFLKPMVCTDTNGQPKAVIGAGDVVIFFNFRTDRPREITYVLSQADMPDYDMQCLNLHYVTMTSYDETFKNVEVVFKKDNLPVTLGEWLASKGLSQVRIAETEKYPHVTFFFSGGREAAFENEKRIMIPSPKVATYDEQPEMSAHEVTDAIVAEVEENQPDFICLNYANTDMVGHTGVFTAGMKAAETVDTCLQRLVKQLLRFDYEILIIADHGNADCMVNEDETPNTAHTVNPVPCFYIGNDVANKKMKAGKLADVAPTLLAMMGLEKPVEMTGNNLLIMAS